MRSANEHDSHENSQSDISPLFHLPQVIVIGYGLCELRKINKTIFLFFFLLA